MEGLGHVLDSLGQACTDDQLKEMIQAADYDGDGVIDCKPHGADRSDQ